MNEIISYIDCYLKLKEDYKDYNKENLYDIFTIFSNEVFELTDIVSEIDYKINSKIEEDYSDVFTTINMLDEKEENLLNEIADVLLTTARLIKTFNLEEPLIEMMEYKYHRQLVRELNRFKNNKNELLK